MTMPEKKKVYRMMPAYGGEPLPWPPIIGPWDGPLKFKKAAEYAAVLKKELDSDDVPKWNGQQRQEIRRKLLKWEYRAAGKDSHYNKHGTFRRPMQAEPPGNGDWMAEKVRRRAMEKGDYVSSAAHRRKFKTNFFQQASDRLVRANKGKTIKPPED